MSVEGSSSDPAVMGSYHLGSAPLPGEFTGALEKNWAKEEEGELGKN